MKPAPLEQDKQFVLELRVPNVETRAAMKDEITRNHSARFSSAEELFASLEKISGPSAPRWHSRGAVWGVEERLHSSFFPIRRIMIRMQADEAEIIVLHGEGGPERLADAQGVDWMPLRAAH